MKNSVIFWNSLYVLGLIIFGIYFIEGLGVYLFLKSILFFAEIGDGNLEPRTKNFKGYYINFFTGIAAIVWCLVMGGIWIHKKALKPIYDETISKFNKFLNGE